MEEWSTSYGQVCGHYPRSASSKIGNRFYGRYSFIVELFFSHSEA